MGAKHTTETEDGMEEILDPRQKKFWETYLNPKHKYFCNAYRSALDAGYKDSTARIITNSRFFKERLRRYNLLSKSEFILDKALSYKSETTDAETGEEVVDKELLRVQTDVAKHITKTLGKDEGYSERSEVSGANGQPIVFMPAELIEKFGLGSDNKDAIQE